MYVDISFPCYTLKSIYVLNGIFRKGKIIPSFRLCPELMCGQIINECYKRRNEKIYYINFTFFSVKGPFDYIYNNKYARRFRYDHNFVLYKLFTSIIIFYGKQASAKP